MGYGPASRDSRGGRKSSGWKSHSPQVILPHQLSAWPHVNLPKAPSSASKLQSGKTPLDSTKSENVFGRPNEAKVEENRSQSRKNGAPSRRSDQMKVDNRTGNTDNDADTNSSPLTLDNGSSERKERLKDATASQKRDKSTGKKKNREKGRSENVFNARSPTQEDSNFLARGHANTPTQSRKRMNANNSSALTLSGSNLKAAKTEAQLRAELLARSGHQEFSSHLFDGSSEDESEPRSGEDTAEGRTKKNKRRKIEDVELDPVKAEIEKQQAKFNNYMSERMKKNPDHYFKDGVSDVHDVSSGGEIQGSSAYDANTSRSDVRNNGSQSLIKKDKDSRKRKRDQQLSSGEKETESTAPRLEHQKPLSLQQLGNAPPMTVVADNTSANSEFIATLKSLREIIPNAFLYTSMMNLNKAHRHSLHAKLKLCQKGKQTNRHIRIVTRVDENGDEVELLEEYGKIIEPEPYTMRSELTLLTAAKDLIILLSGQITADAGRRATERQDQDMKEAKAEE